MRLPFLMISCWLLTTSSLFAQAKPDEGVRRALLVGVTEYPNLPKRLNLEGPSNDVQLMRDLLISRFDFASDKIVSLTEESGTKNERLLPTRANIAAEFQRLDELAKPNDEFVILLAGHGSQQPQRANAKEPEIDGLDETFLPRDVEGWDQKTGTVKNAIIDDELGEWISKIVEKNAFVWLLVDSCHSGTMIRDYHGEKQRQIRMDDLGIPAADIQKAKRNAKPQNPLPKGEQSRSVAPRPTVNFSGQAGVCALYAAQPDETAPEAPMPPGDASAKVHGALTFAVCRILGQAKTAGTPISYKELAQRVVSTYTAWGRNGPTPMIEHPATDADREVLGKGGFNRKDLALQRKNEVYQVNGGSLIGLTMGSILEVRPPAGQGEQVLGYVRIHKPPQVLISDVELVEYQKTPAPKNLEADCRCRVIFIDYGDVEPIRVAVAEVYPSVDGVATKPIPAEIRKRWLEPLKQAAGKPDSRFQLVEKISDLKNGWILSPSSEKADSPLILLPTNSLSGGDRNRKQGYGPIPTDDKMINKLDDILDRIGRAQGLLQLANDASEAILREREDSPQFRVEFVLCNDNQKKVIPWPDPAMTLKNKDEVDLLITNTGAKAIDLSLLFVDGDYAIESLYPENGVGNRLEPGRTKTLHIRPVTKAEITTEHLVIIAVKGEGLERHFRDLEQSGPEQFRESFKKRTVGLDRLVDRRMYRNDSKEVGRGPTQSAVGDYAIRLVSYRLIK